MQKFPEVCAKLCISYCKNRQINASKLVENWLRRSLRKSALREQQEEQTKHKYIPEHYKWTISTSAIVTMVLVLFMNIMFGMQSSAMNKQAIDSGESLAKFIATEAAVPLLNEDWISLEILLNDASSLEAFSYLIVPNRNLTVRTATNNELLEQPSHQNEATGLVSYTNDAHTTSSKNKDGAGMFSIDTSALFQNIKVGKIILGISQASLDQVKSVIGWLMILLGLITIFCTSRVMFIVASLIAKSLKSAGKAMEKLEQGDFDALISLQRNDEMGKVFEAINAIASSIQARYSMVFEELALYGFSIAKENYEISPAYQNTIAR